MVKSGLLVRARIVLGMSDTPSPSIICDKPNASRDKRGVFRREIVVGDDGQYCLRYSRRDDRLVHGAQRT